MPYIADPAEASRILGKPVGNPVYKTIRMDDSGNGVAVPVFRIEEEAHLKRKAVKFLLPAAGILLVMILACIVALMADGLMAHAEGPGYDYIEQTEDPEVIALTEEVAEIYPICPELLQAVVFYESSNRRAVISRWGDVGYMQINPRWQQARMDKLGITDLKDGYSNILIGADLLYELFIKYEDPALVLMAYNEGEEQAICLYNSGRTSSYARNILELSEKLERLHEK